MTDTHDLQVKTIFSVSEPRRSRSRPSVRPARPPSRPSSGRVFPPVLGVLTLLVGATWLYVTWYPLDRYLGRQMMMRGLAEMSIDWSALMPAPPASVADPSPPSVDLDDTGDDEWPEGDPETVVEYEPVDGGLEESHGGDLPAAQILHRLSLDMYTWLTVTTAVIAWLALCGGAGLAGAAGRGAARNVLRTLMVILGLGVAGLAAWFWCYAWLADQHEWLAWGVGVRPPDVAEIVLVAGVALWCVLASAVLTRGWAAVLAIGLLLTLAGLAAHTWNEYEAAWPQIRPRIAVLMLFAMAALVGTIATGRARGLHAAAVVLILLAGGATVGAMTFAHQHEFFSDLTVTATTYVKAFGIQSAYALLLLVLLRFVPKRGPAA